MARLFPTAVFAKAKTIMEKHHDKTNYPKMGIIQR